MSTKKDRIPENKLLKAIAELEQVAKGDALEEADPEGGLSTEGEPLSEAAPRGRGETKKSRRASASSPFGGASPSSSAESGDDASSPMPPPKNKKKGKDAKVSKAASTRSSSGGESESESDDDSDDAEKSFREMADDDEKMRKGILVNDFLEAMVDQMSLALLHVKESVTKSLAEMEERITDSIAARFAKSSAASREFDVRLATGIAAIGNTLHGDLLPMVDLVKSLADQPVGSPRGKAVLSKGEINQPPWGGPQGDRQLAGSDGDYVEELRGLGMKPINDWLFKKSATNQIDQNVILAFEADRYDPAMLPLAVRKALVEDLIK